MHGTHQPLKADIWVAWFRNAMRELSFGIDVEFQREE